MGKLRKFSSYQPSSQAKIQACSFKEGGFRHRIKSGLDPYMLLQWNNKGKVIAWACIVERDGSIGGSKYIELLVYVRPEHRRQKLGVNLVCSAYMLVHNHPDIDTITHPIYVYPWNERSTKFFNSSVFNWLNIEKH